MGPVGSLRSGFAADQAAAKGGCSRTDARVAIRLCPWLTCVAGQYSSGSKMVVAERWPRSAVASVMIQIFSPARVM